MPEVDYFAIRAVLLQNEQNRLTKALFSVLGIIDLFHKCMILLLFCDLIANND